MIAIKIFSADPVTSQHDQINLILSGIAPARRSPQRIGGFLFPDAGK
jgi:hypothetical protein